MKSPGRMKLPPPCFLYGLCLRNHALHKHLCFSGYSSHLPTRDRGSIPSHVEVSMGITLNAFHQIHYIFVDCQTCCPCKHVHFGGLFFCTFRWYVTLECRDQMQASRRKVQFPRKHQQLKQESRKQQQQQQNSWLATRNQENKKPDRNWTNGGADDLLCAGQ